MSGPVVTGLGILAPTGAGTETYWEATLAGRSAIGPVTRFDASGYPSRLAGEIGLDVDPLVPRRLLAQTDRMTRLALVAADWALAEASCVPADLDEYAMSVATACSSGGFEFGQRELQKLWGHGPHHVSAYQSFAWFYAVNTGQISIRHGMRGPSGVLVAEQAGGLDVLGQARRLLRAGGDLVVTGAVDSALCPWGWTAATVAARTSTSDEPRRAFLPFDVDASGHVVGEGGAILVLETPRAAAARDAPPSYGELAGYAATFDVPARAGGSPGEGLRRAVVGALADAELEPADIGVVYADAAGRPDADAAEAAALRAVFGERGVPVTAPKAGVGRLSSGGGPLDVATALLGLRDGLLPPTPNVTTVRRELGLDVVVDRPRARPHRAALVLARGVGGFNAAVVVARP